MIGLGVIEEIKSKLESFKLEEILFRGFKFDIKNILRFKREKIDVFFFCFLEM